MLKHMLPNTRTALPGSESWLERAENDDHIFIRVKCSECGEIFSKPLSPTELSDVELLYANGGHHPDGHVQDVFPDWSPADRELFLQSHLCDRCWKKLMSPPDEAEDGE